MKTFWIATSLMFCACIPEHDYSGDYDMTYAVLMTPEGSQQVDARAGTTQVEVHRGLNQEYLVNLGASFCRLEGTYVKAMIETDWPYLDIAPQDCWFAAAGKTIPMTLTGTATFDKIDATDQTGQRFTIVLSGSYTDGDALRGSTTVQLTETW